MAIKSLDKSTKKYGANFDVFFQKGFQIFDSTKITFGDLLEAVSSHFDVTREEIKELAPRPPSSSGDRVTLSSLYGLGKFPFHTDGANFRVPPRLLVMRLKKGSASSSATLMIDADDLIKDPEALSQLQKVYIVKGEEGRFYSRILNKTLIPGKVLVRYNPVLMRHAGASGKESFEELLARQSPIRIDWDESFFILIDNWRVFHAREQVNTTDVTLRVLERVWFRVTI